MALSVSDTIKRKIPKSEFSDTVNADILIPASPNILAKILGEAGINMSAFTVSENSDFGILRLIVSDTDKAIKVLRDRLYAVSVAEVVCLHCPNQPGALAKAMDIITKAGIFIEYMYAFSQGEAANVIIRPDNVERCAEVLKENKLELIAANDLYKL